MVIFFYNKYRSKISRTKPYLKKPNKKYLGPGILNLFSVTLTIYVDDNDPDLWLKISYTVCLES